MSGTAAATYCATLVDEWIRGGVRHAVIAPGSRSTPLAIALAERRELEIHVVHDERPASFMALGIGLATGVPAVLLCTSGTAAAHFHAAVVEAHQAEVPMIVCTADRPPELREVGAAQTIDQLRLYGGATRWFHDPGVPAADRAADWRPMAARAVAVARGPRPGPVHLNLPFREPLVGTVETLPPHREGAWIETVAPPPRLSSRQLAELVSVVDRQRGVIVCGRTAGEASGDAAHRLGRILGWPVLADPRSGARIPAAGTIAAYDALLRHQGFAADHCPEIVVRIGTPPASKVLEQWIASSGAVEVQIAPTDAWLDPAGRTAHRVVADVAALAADLDGQLVGASRTPWLARWRRAEAAAQQAIDDWMDADGGLSEPAVARTVVAAIPDGGRLMVSSSMPVRDVEWFGAPRTGLTVHANRGANGIDGIIATGTGVAAGTEAPTTILLGDLAFLHDSSALAALARRRVVPSIVVIDNDGGGIFSFLPQASALTRDRFELLFGTPHGTDLAALASAHGLPTAAITDRSMLTDFVSSGGGGVAVVRSDRAANVAAHEAIHDAVRRALDR